MVKTCAPVIIKIIAFNNDMKYTKYQLYHLSIGSNSLYICSLASWCSDVTSSSHDCKDGRCSSHCWEWIYKVLGITSLSVLIYYDNFCILYTSCTLIHLSTYILDQYINRLPQEVIQKYLYYVQPL